MKHNTLGPDVTFPHPRSAAEQSMDTSEPKAGSSSSSAPTPAQPQAASGDPFKESDVANLVKMGFPREVSSLLRQLNDAINSRIILLLFQVAIAELRKCNGDANLAIANLFAKSLSEGFNKKK